MLLDETTLYWIGAAGMVLGMLYPLWFLVREPGRRRYYGTLVGVTGVAAAAYVVMALGLGTVTVAGTPVQLARYVDWLITTPLLVLYLGFLSRLEWRAYAALVVTDVVVIAAGVGAAVASSPLATAGLFAVGCAAYVALAYMLLVVLPRAQAGADVPAETRDVFTKLRNVTVVLWTLYPLVWALSGTGVGLLNQADESLVFVYLDFIAKVGFVVIAVNGRHALRVLDGTATLSRSGADGAATADE